MTERANARLRTLVSGLSSPPLLVAVTALVFVWATLRDVSSVRLRAGSLAADVEQARAELAAETALWRNAEAGGGVVHDEVCGVRVELLRKDGAFELRCRDRAGRLSAFRAPLLDGAAPAVFAHARVACDLETLERIGDGKRMAHQLLPRLDEQQLAAAAHANELHGFRRDAGVALASLAAGTDREDFVWFDGTSSCKDGLLVVPGNLWIPAQRGTFDVHLPRGRDLVVVVEGNLYLRSSVRVVGGGRLLLVTRTVPGAVAFADLDGSGTWSDDEPLRGAARFRGPVEGSGMVYVGAPGASELLRSDAGLLVTGELHLATDAAVAGPLVLHHGATVLGGEPRRVVGARWTFRPARERIPGFVVEGSPRPGLLRRVERGDGADAVSAARATSPATRPR